MEEYSANSFANREDTVPIFSVDALDDLSDEGGAHHAETPTTRQRIRENISKLRKSDNPTKSDGKSASKRASMQDRLIEKLLQQVIPVENLSSNRTGAPGSAQQEFTERPNFNVATMSTNFRRFNSRIGVVFVFQARMIDLMSWKAWSHTLSFLAVYTFVCLDPHLLAVLPLAVLLLAILIPAFIARHPAAPTDLLTSFEYMPTGPPIAPAPTVKPVKELSRDFFRNMRDLQNCMEDFSRAHDKIISLLTPPTNFSNESLSSTLFLFLFAATAIMLIASNLIPWRFLFLISGWFVTCIGHPKLQQFVLAAHKEHMQPRSAQVQLHLDAWIAQDIVLDSAPETREVEIFELQRRTTAGEWEAWLFSPTPYDPLSPARIADERPTGTRFFEDVKAPSGWVWSDKKWALDLWSREWVDDRIITAVEIETVGERWVYDIDYEKPPPVGVVDAAAAKKKSLKDKEKGSGWEESLAAAGKRGEWRRRRWTRLVKRKTIGGA